MFVFTATPLVVTAVTFVLYAALNGQLTAAKAFTSLSLFNILRFPLSVVPMMISRVIDLTVVNKRLSKFFNSGLRGTQIVHDGGGAAGAPAAPMAFDGHFANPSPSPNPNPNPNLSPNPNLNQATSPRAAVRRAARRRSSLPDVPSAGPR